MLRKLKIAVIRMMSYVCRTVLKIKGVQVGNGVIIPNLPRVKMARGGAIRLGDQVTIHSGIMFNPISNHRTSLSAAAPGAEIVLESGSGLSGVTIFCLTRVRIGKGTLIGGDTLIMDTDMHYRELDGTWGSSIGKPEYGKPIDIGENCFIGARCTILKGVTIGDGSVVAANAMVTRDVPPHSLAMGNPATVRPLRGE